MLWGGPAGIPVRTRDAHNQFHGRPAHSLVSDRRCRATPSNQMQAKKDEAARGDRIVGYSQSPGALDVDETQYDQDRQLQPPVRRPEPQFGETKLPQIPPQMRRGMRVEREGLGVNRKIQEEMREDREPH